MLGKLADGTTKPRARFDERAAIWVMNGSFRFAGGPADEGRLLGVGFAPQTGRIIQFLRPR